MTDAHKYRLSLNTSVAGFHAELYLDYFIFALCVNRGRTRLRVCFTVQRRLFPKENETHDDVQKAPEQQVNKCVSCLCPLRETRDSFCGAEPPGLVLDQCFGLSYQQCHAYSATSAQLFCLCPPPGAERTKTHGNLSLHLRPSHELPQTSKRLEMLLFFAVSSF